MKGMAMVAVAALLALAPAAGAIELTNQDRAWGRAIARALGEPTVQVESSMVRVEGRGGAVNVLSVRAVGQRVRVERGWFLSAEQAEGVACLSGSPRTARVGEGRGDELVLVEGQLGDGPWARALLDAAWTVYEAPTSPRTCLFAYLSDGERAVDARFLAGERGATMRRETQQALAAARGAAGAGVVQNGPDDFTVRVKNGTFARVGVDARAVHTWSLRAPTSEALARLASFLRAIGGGAPPTRPAPAATRR